jgi:hypothetical protein
MEATSLIFEDKLDGASNYLSWNAMVTLLLEENYLWDIAKDVVTSPTDPHELETHKKMK